MIKLLYSRPISVPYCKKYRPIESSRLFAAA